MCSRAHAIPGALIAACLVLIGATRAGAAEQGGATHVSIAGAHFQINDEQPHARTAAQGLLLNARMINAAFDDENAATLEHWAYPDSGVWDPERNTDEFVSAVPSYAAHGLRAVTVGMQGGRPMQDATQRWSVSAFESDGMLKPAWLDRLDRIVRACDANGIVVVLSLFYKAQDQQLDDEAAVKRAVDATTDWVLARGYTNVVIEVGNETNDAGWDHAILRENRITELIGRVQDRSGGRLLASTSFRGGYVPTDAVIRHADFVLVHGNSQSASGIAGMIDEIRSRSAYREEPKPIVFNEDSTSLENLQVAVGGGASWGYHDRGANNYVDGFQSVPINWTINTAAKRAFFDRVREVTGGGEPPPAETVDIDFSTSPDRDASTPLEGATVSGELFAFVPSSAGIEEVRFHLDDPERAEPPHRIERTAPYDFAGTAGDGTATAFDSTTLGEGLHSITAAVEYVDAGVVVETATFTVSNASGEEAPTLEWDPSVIALSADEGAAVSYGVSLRTSGGTTSYSATTDAPWLTVSAPTGTAPASVTVNADSSTLARGTYEATATATADDGEAPLRVTFTVRAPSPAPSHALLVSGASDRSAPTTLAAKTVSGSVYVFLEAAGSVSSVAFYVDDPDHEGKPRRLELRTPWDFAGADKSGVPRAFDTTTVADGEHVITAVVHLADGGNDIVHAAFFVDNG